MAPNPSSQVIVPHNQPLTEGDITQNDVQPRLSYRQRRRAQQALQNARKRGPTRGLKSLREMEQNCNVKPFANITPDMERVVGKNANRFIGECSKWVKEFCPLDSRNWIRMGKDAKKRLLDKIKAEWNLPVEADGINVARALELQCVLLFRGWHYRLKEEHFAGKTITQAISNRPSEVHKEQWDWLVNHWADPKQQIIPSLMHP